ncbi:MAG: VWA domain-containing protein [Candidatus Micrarchaeia archaeon]
MQMQNEIIPYLQNEVKLFNNILLKVRRYTIELKLTEDKENEYIAYTTILENDDKRKEVFVNLNNEALKTTPAAIAALQHEEAHALFTTGSFTKTIQQLSKEFPEVATNDIRYIVNLIEDYRIEYLWKKILYPGSERNFSKLYGNILDKMEEDISKVTNAGKNYFDPIALLYTARMALSTSNQKILDIQSQIPNESKQLYNDFVEDFELTSGRDFDSVYVASKRVINRIKEYLKNNENNFQSGNSQQNGEGEYQNEAGKKKLDIGDSSKLPKLFANQDQNDIGSQKDKVNDSSKENRTDEEILKKSNEEMIKKIERIVQNNFDVINEINDIIRKTQEAERQQQSESRGGTGLKSTNSLYMEEKQKESSYVKELKRAIEALHKNKPRLESAFRGRLDVGKVIRYNAERQNFLDHELFLRREITNDGVDITILLDTSQSMITDNKIDTATKILLTLEKTVKNSNKIKLDIFAFPGNFSALYEVDKNKIASLSVGGGTPLGNALSLLNKKMNEDKSKNPLAHKFLFIITDGEPDSNEATNYAIKELKKSDITIFTIFVGVDDDLTIRSTFEACDGLYFAGEMNNAGEQLFKQLSKEIMKVAEQKKKQKSY